MSENYEIVGVQADAIGKWLKGAKVAPEEYKPELRNAGEVYFKKIISTKLNVCVAKR